MSLDEVRAFVPRLAGVCHGLAGLPFPTLAAVRGAAAIRARLAPAFRPDEETRLPFFIPHHARSGQLGVAHIQRFTRNR